MNMPTPTEVRAPSGSNVMEITWDDGHVSVHPHEILRGYCPCAVCQGHSGPIRFVETTELAVTAIDEVGNYALCFTWSDGHSTGIYDFRYLRRLCACPSCAAASGIGSRATLARSGT